MEIMFKEKPKQSGQSLIETIGAIFILTMALTTALGLAVFAFSRSAVSQNEIIATNLAREGVDVLQDFRDTSWLVDEISSNSDFQLQSCPELGGKECYPMTFAGGTPGSYDWDAYASDGNNGDQRVILNTGTGQWNFDTSDTAFYNLYLQPNGAYTDTPLGTSTFARMIEVTYNDSPPYTRTGVGLVTYPPGIGTELIVKSVVAWRGKGCTDFAASQNLLSFSTPCRIIVEEHLTNWKDYE